MRQKKVKNDCTVTEEKMYDSKNMLVKLPKDVVDKVEAICNKKNIHKNDLLGQIIIKNIDDLDDIDRVACNDEHRVYSLMSRYTYSKLTELLHKYNKSHTFDITPGQYIIQLIIDAHRDYISKGRKDSIYTSKGKDKDDNKNNDKSIKEYINHKASIMKHNMKYFQSVIDNLSTAIEFKDSKHANLILDTINRANNSIEKFNTAMSDFVTAIHKEIK